MLAVVDAEHTLLVTGNGDVIQPTDGVLGIGSGGNYAVAAARALLAHSSLARPRSCARRWKLPPTSTYTRTRISWWRNFRARPDPSGNRRRIGPSHRRPGRRQAGGGRGHPQPLAAAAARRRDAARGGAEEHPHDRAHRRRQDRDRPAAGQAHRRAVHQGRGDALHRGRLLRPRRGEHGPRAGGERHRPGPAAGAGKRRGRGPPPRRRAAARPAGAGAAVARRRCPTARNSPERYQRTREKMRAMLAAGELEDRKVEITLEHQGRCR